MGAIRTLRRSSEIFGSKVKDTQKPASAGTAYEQIPFAKYDAFYTLGDTK